MSPWNIFLAKYHKENHKGESLATSMKEASKLWKSKKGGIMGMNKTKKMLPDKPSGDKKPGNKMSDPVRNFLNKRKNNKKQTKRKFPFGKNSQPMTQTMPPMTQRMAQNQPMTQRMAQNQPMTQPMTQNQPMTQPMTQNQRMP